MSTIELSPDEKIMNFESYKKAVFATGCFIIPAKLKYPDGEIKYVWVVDSFEDDTFEEGSSINPTSWADSKRELYGRD